jgi:hypothetical protein
VLESKLTHLSASLSWGGECKQGVDMNQITIRNLDPGLLKLLRQTAWQNGTFVEEYVRQLIIEGLQRSHQATQSSVE